MFGFLLFYSYSSFWFHIPLKIEMIIQYNLHIPILAGTVLFTLQLLKSESLFLNCNRVSQTMEGKFKLFRGKGLTLAFYS